MPRSAYAAVRRSISESGRLLIWTSMATGSSLLGSLLVAALERLQALYQQTGRRTSLLAAVSEYAEASARLATKAEAEKWFSVALAKSVANVIPLPATANA